jgi:tetratricopeptide (TPR) repeat protein
LIALYLTCFNSKIYIIEKSCDEKGGVMGSGDSVQSSPDGFLDENLRAEELVNCGKNAEAAAILTGIIADDPRNWRAYNSMGVIAWSSKNWNDAYAFFRKSVDCCPDYSDALVNFFDASIKLKKVAETLSYFEEALRRNPSLEEIRIIRDSIVSLGDDIYFSHRALGIGVYSALVEEAEKELEAGNLFKAMEKFLKANDEEGPSAAAFCGLGIISYYQQRYVDAYTLFIESIKLNPSNPDVFVNLLDAAKACDKVSNAKEIFETCRKEYPVLEKVAREFSAA